MSIIVRSGSIDEVLAIQELIPEFDDPYSKSEYQRRLGASEHLVLIAELDGFPVGFKVGYDRFLDGEVFYSWMGAVLPEHRSKGIGRLLLKKMEVWCKLKGYHYLKFKTMNRHRNMLKFAISEGFNVIDFQKHQNPRLSKIYFEKKL
ncbi:GNAT family N-acetyltransferase [Marinoscillum sp.]|uniref:GNAT family N-acetyltransferase n=1 Tax=Marinoscillum sp. TaxID=2024838 RepID=UPI003BA8F9CF